MTVGLGKDQWLRYHFNSSDSREDNSANIRAEFTKKARGLVPFNKICKEVAEEIYELNKDKKLFVSMSGGCDSELVARSFYDLGIKFTPIIHELWFMGLQISYADTWWAHRWLAERNIKPIVRNITVSELFADMKPYADKLKARKLYSVQNVLLAEYAKRKDGVLINGQAFPEYYPDHTLEYLKDIIHDTQFNTNSTGWLVHEDDFYIDMNDPGYHPYNFLSWNPEIVASYIAARDMNLNSEENKFKIMNCLPRPKQAVSDAVWPILNEYQRKLKRKYGSSELTFFGTHEEVLNQLL